MTDDQPTSVPAGGRAAPREARIAVVGAGLSGVLTAVHLLWRCRPGERIYLVERSDRLGPGLAYATDSPRHLLNVRAERMSAFADEPDHFERWLRALPEVEREAAAVATTAGLFVRRQIYGAYVAGLLRDAIAKQGGSENLFIVNDGAAAIHPTEDGLQLRCEGGRSYPVDTAVLALGNFPPSPSILPGYAGDPWAKEALAGLDPERPVLLLGTGLTMADVCLSLLDAGFRGPLLALSRRGLLPQAHGPAPLAVDFHLSGRDRRSLVTLTRAVRREVRRAGERGADWRGVVDALRPHLPLLWQEMRPDDRQRFLRHLRPWWETHRHRLAPPVARTLRELRTTGRLLPMAGRLVGIAPSADGVAVTCRPRGADAVTEFTVQRVIDCTGPAMDVTRIADPLVRQLLGNGLAAPDPLGLGFHVTHAGALVGEGGSTARPVFAIGTLARAASYEMTAVPEIAHQAEQVAINALSAARRATAMKAPPVPPV